MDRVKVFTNSTFNETIEIEKYLQPVTYHVVLGINFFADFMSSFSDFFGGRSQSYQSRLESINHEVIKGIKDKTYKLGGNAAIDLKIDNDEISAQGKSMIMVTAIATAVIIKKDDKKVNYNSKVEDSLGSVSLDEFKHFKDKLYLQTKLKLLVHGGPIGRLILDIKPDNYDLLPDIFQCIRKAETSPRDFPEDVKNALRVMLNVLDFKQRSKFFYNELKYYLSSENQVEYRVGKISFINNEIFESNCINYELINQLIDENTELTNSHVLNHYREGIDKKLVFFPSDINHLQKGIEICKKNGYDASIISIIEVMIDTLNKILNK